MHSAVRSFGVNVSNPTNGKVLLLVAGSQCKPLHLWWSSIFSSVFVSVPVSSFPCFPVAQVLERRMACNGWYVLLSSTTIIDLSLSGRVLSSWVQQILSRIHFCVKVHALLMVKVTEAKAVEPVSLQTLCPLCCMDPVGKHCYCQIKCMHCFG